MGKAVFRSGLDIADLFRRDTSLKDIWIAVIDELRWSVKSFKELKIWHDIHETDREGARLHLRRATRGARKSENARERAFICLLTLRGTAEGPQIPDDVAQVVKTGWAAGERLDLLWKKLEEVFAFLAAVGDGTGDDDPRARLTRRFLKRWLRSAAERILAHIKRRQRWKAAAPEDAPGKPSRGRAPPSFEYCIL